MITVATAPATKFIGIVSTPGKAIVDTAAESGCLGSLSLPDLAAILATFGRSYAWAEVPGEGVSTDCVGVGGSAKWLGNIEFPAGIGGLNGIIKMAVLEDTEQARVPVLLPVSIQHQLEFRIDLKTNQCEIQKCPLSDGQPRIVTMDVMKPQNFREMSITDYAPEGWEPPSDATEQERLDLMDRFSLEKQKNIRSFTIIYAK